MYGKVRIPIGFSPDFSFEDFDGKKTVLISDEAHHINVDTRRMNKQEEESYHSWEQTVRNIFERSNDNVLLEFTAKMTVCNNEGHF